MQWFIALNNIYARKLDLGLYDNYLNQVQKYVLEGDLKAKEYLEKIFTKYNYTCQFPKNDKFVKDTHYTILFSSVVAVLIYDSVVTICNLTPTCRTINFYEPMGNKIAAKFENLSDEELIKLSSIFEDENHISLSSKDHKKALELMENAISLDTSLLTSLDLDHIDDDSSDTQENISIFSGSQQLSSDYFLNVDEILKKLPNLNLKVKDYLKTTSLAAANSNKRQNKKLGAKNAKNQQANALSVDFGYRVAPDMPLSYFQPSNDVDYGFNILKIIDLCGLHVLLVAQRRKFYFDVTGLDEFRNNYDILKKFDQDKLVDLHDQCVKACLEYQVYCEQAKDKTFMLGAYNAYIKRANAFINYLEYLKNVYKSFGTLALQINPGSDWSSSRLFFEFFRIFEIAYKFCLTSKNPNCLMLLTNRSAKAIDFFKSSDVQILKNLNSIVPMTIYQACSMYSSFYQSVEDTHPRVINFKTIVANILNYSNIVYPTSISLPFATKLDNYTYSEESYKLDLDAMSDSDGKQAELEARKYNYLSKELKLNLTQNEYLTCFNYLSYCLDIINYLLLMVSLNQASYKGNVLLFNWYCLNAEDNENVFNSYQETIAEYHFTSLQAQHLNCLKLLVKIMTLSGNLKELYSDNYLTNLLKLTNLYDEANESKLKKRTKKVTLSQSEQSQLNELCGEFLLSAKDLFQNLYSFLNDYYVRFLCSYIEGHENFRADYQYLFTNVKQVINFAYIFMDNMILQLDPAPSALKQHMEAHSQLYVQNEFSHTLYQRTKECASILFNSDIALIGRMFSSYLAYQDKTSFDKYFALMCPYFKDRTKIDYNLIGVLSMCRLQELDPKLYSSVRKTAYQHPIVSNSLIFVILHWFGTQLTKLYTALLYEFFMKLSNYIDKDDVEQDLPELNLLFNIISKAMLIDKLQDYMYNFSDQCTYQSLPCILSPDLKVITANLTSMIGIVVKFIANYKDKFKSLSELNDNNVLNNQVDFLQLLHNDPIKALEQIEIHNINYIDECFSFSSLITLKGKGGKDFFRTSAKIFSIEDQYPKTNLKILSNYFFGPEFSQSICPKSISVEDFDMEEDEIDFWDIELAREPSYDQSCVDFVKINIRAISDEEMGKVFSNYQPFKLDDNLGLICTKPMKMVENTVTLNYEPLLEKFKTIVSDEQLYSSFDQPELKARVTTLPSDESSALEQPLVSADTDAAASAGAATDASVATTATASASADAPTSNEASAVSNAQEQTEAKAGAEALVEASSGASDSVGTGASASASASVDAKESTQENSASDKSANISSAQLPELKAHLKSDADINEPSNNMKPASRSRNHVSSDKAPHSEAKANTKSEIKIRTTKMPTASEIEAMKAQLAKKDKLNELNIRARSNKLLEVTVDAILKGVVLIESKTLKSENIEKVILAMALEELHKYDLGPKLHMFDDLINKFSHIIYVATQAQTLPVAKQQLLNLKQKCQAEQLKSQKEIASYKK